MPTRISKFMGDALLDMWSTIFADSKIAVCSGKQPKSADEPMAGEVLVTFQLPHVPFRDSTDAETNLHDQIFARATANGFAEWFRVTKADGTPLLDGTVGAEEGQLHINSTQIVKGGEVILNSFKQTLEVG